MFHMPCSIKQDFGRHLSCNIEHSPDVALEMNSTQKLLSNSEPISSVYLSTTNRDGLRVSGGGHAVRGFCGIGRQADQKYVVESNSQSDRGPWRARSRTAMPVTTHAVT